MRINNNLFAWLLIALLSLIWGSSFILMKRGLEVFSSLQVGCIRIAIAFLLLSVFSIPNLKAIPADKWKYLLVSGLIGNFIPALLFATAQTSLSSSVTGVLNALTPLFTLLISMVAFRYRIHQQQAFGLLLGFVGSISLSFLRADGKPGTINYYVLYVVLATLCYGISTNVIKTYLSDVKAILVSSCAMLTVGPLAMLYLFTTDFTTRLSMTATLPTGELVHKGWIAFGYMVILGGVGTAFALYVFNKLIQMTSALAASSVTYLIPVVAVMWGFFDNENMGVWHLAGMAMIIAGVYLVNSRKVEKVEVKKQRETVSS